MSPEQPTGGTPQPEAQRQLLGEITLPMHSGCPRRAARWTGQMLQSLVEPPHLKRALNRSLLRQLQGWAAATDARLILRLYLLLANQPPGLGWGFFFISSASASQLLVLEIYLYQE